MDALDLQDVPTQRRASLALDAIATSRSTYARQYRRPAALTAREALAVLQFDAFFVSVAAANVRAGFTLEDEDFDRLALAIRTIDAIVAEVT